MDILKSGKIFQVKNYDILRSPVPTIPNSDNKTKNTNPNNKNVISVSSRLSPSKPDVLKRIMNKTSITNKSLPLSVSSNELEQLYRQSPLPITVQQMIESRKPHSVKPLVVNKELNSSIESSNDDTQQTESLPFFFKPKPRGFIPPRFTNVKDNDQQNITSNSIILKDSVTINHIDTTTTNNNNNNNTVKNTNQNSSPNHLVSNPSGINSVSSVQPTTITNNSSSSSSLSNTLTDSNHNSIKTVHQETLDTNINIQSSLQNQSSLDNDVLDSPPQLIDIMPVNNSASIKNEDPIKNNKVPIKISLNSNDKHIISTRALDNDSIDNDSLMNNENTKGIIPNQLLSSTNKDAIVANKETKNSVNLDNNTIIHSSIDLTDTIQTENKDTKNNRNNNNKKDEIILSESDASSVKNEKITKKNRKSSKLNKTKNTLTSSSSTSSNSSSSSSSSSSSATTFSSINTIIKNNTNNIQVNKNTNNKNESNNNEMVTNKKKRQSNVSINSKENRKLDENKQSQSISESNTNNDHNKNNDNNKTINNNNNNKNDDNNKIDDNSDNNIIIQNNQSDDSNDFCYICHDVGELLICEGKNCHNSFHLNCLGLKRIPKNKWLCPICRGVQIRPSIYIRQHTLIKWYLSTIHSDKSKSFLIIEGYKIYNNEQWRCSPLSLCIDETHFKTLSGSLYILKGKQNMISSKEHGFSEDIINAFENGIPKNWKHLVQIELKHRATPDTISKKSSKKEYLNSTVSMDSSAFMSTKKINKEHDPIEDIIDDILDVNINEEQSDNKNNNENKQKDPVNIKKIKKVVSVKKNTKKSNKKTNLKKSKDIHNQYDTLDSFEESLYKSDSIKKPSIENQNSLSLYNNEYIVNLNTTDSLSSSIYTSHSGRKIIPPLPFWKNQRLVPNSRDDNVTISLGTPFVGNGKSNLKRFGSVQVKEETVKRNYQNDDNNDDDSSENDNNKIINTIHVDNTIKNKRVKKNKVVVSNDSSDQETSIVQNSMIENSETCQHSMNNINTKKTKKNVFLSSDDDTSDSIENKNIYSSDSSSSISNKENQQNIKTNSKNPIFMPAWIYTTAVESKEWTQEDLELLKRTILSEDINPSQSHYWQLVGDKVGHTGRDCHNQWFKIFNTKDDNNSEQPRNGVKPFSKLATKGSLKRLKQIRQLCSDELYDPQNIISNDTNNNTINDVNTNMQYLQKKQNFKNLNKEWTNNAFNISTPMLNRRESLVFNNNDSDDSSLSDSDSTSVTLLKNTNKDFSDKYIISQLKQAKTNNTNKRILQSLKKNVKSSIKSNTQHNVINETENINGNKIIAKMNQDGSTQVDVILDENNDLDIFSSNSEEE